MVGAVEDFDGHRELWPLCWQLTARIYLSREEVFEEVFEGTFEGPFEGSFEGSFAGTFEGSFEGTFEGVEIYGGIAVWLSTSF
jgi:hypothetical protein